MGNFVDLKELEENDKDGGFGPSEEKTKEVLVDQVGAESNDEIFEEYNDEFADDDYEPTDDCEYSDEDEDDEFEDEDMDDDNFDIPEDELEDLEGDEQ